MQFSMETHNRIPVIPAKAGIQTPVANPANPLIL